MKFSQPCAPAAKTSPVRLIERVFENGIDPTHSTLSLQRLPLFSNISLPACDEIISAGHEKTFLRQQPIFIQGDPANHVLLLVSGSVKSTQITSTGSEVILRLNGPGELIGAAGFGFKSSNRCAVQAMLFSKAIIWDSAVFAALARRFPVLQQNVICIMAKQLMELEERYRELSTVNVARRLSCEIARLAIRVGEPENGGIKINLSQEELAQMTGTTLFTVSRLLSQWKDKGIVSTGRQFLLVHNSQELAKLFARD